MDDCNADSLPRIGVLSFAMGDVGFETTYQAGLSGGTGPVLGGRVTSMRTSGGYEEAKRSAI